MLLHFKLTTILSLAAALQVSVCFLQETSAASVDVAGSRMAEIQHNRRIVTSSDDYSDSDDDYDEEDDENIVYDEHGNRYNISDHLSDYEKQMMREELLRLEEELEAEHANYKKLMKNLDSGTETVDDLEEWLLQFAMDHEATEHLWFPTKEDVKRRVTDFDHLDEDDELSMEELAIKYANHKPSDMVDHDSAEGVITPMDFGANDHEMMKKKKKTKSILDEHHHDEHKEDHLDEKKIEEMIANLQEILVTHHEEMEKADARMDKLHASMASVGVHDTAFCTDDEHLPDIEHEHDDCCHAGENHDMYLFDQYLPCQTMEHTEPVLSEEEEAPPKKLSAEEIYQNVYGSGGDEDDDEDEEIYGDENLNDEEEHDLDEEHQQQHQQQEDNHHQDEKQEQEQVHQDQDDHHDEEGHASEEKADDHHGVEEVGTHLDEVDHHKKAIEEAMARAIEFQTIAFHDSSDDDEEEHHEDEHEHHDGDHHDDEANEFGYAWGDGYENDGEEESHLDDEDVAALTDDAMARAKGFQTEHHDDEVNEEL